MSLSAPRQITFWISIVLVIVGILANFVSSLGLAGSSLWLVVIAFVILAAGNLFDGL